MRPLLTYLALFTLTTVPSISQVYEASDDISVGIFTVNDQNAPDLDHGPADGFVVVWQSVDADLSDRAVRGQLFSADGDAVGFEFPINSFTTGDQSSPAVSVAPDGTFVVTWVSAQDGSGSSVHARRFDQLGDPVDDEFQVNSNTVSYQDSPAISHQADGESFVVTWQDVVDGDQYGIRASRFDSSGNLLASEFQVNQTTLSSQTSPGISHAPTGGFVVVWQSFGQDGSGWSVVGRRFDDSGSPHGEEFLVNTATPQDQETPDVAHGPDGSFVVVWQSEEQDGDYGSVHGQRFDSAGGRIAEEFQINSYTTDSQAQPRVSYGPDDDFVVVWESYGADGSGDAVRGRRYDAAGEQLWPEFQISSSTSGDQSRPVVSHANDGDFVVGWQGDDVGPSDGVFVKLIQPALFADGFESGDTAAWSTSAR